MFLQEHDSSEYWNLSLFKIDDHRTTLVRLDEGQHDEPCEAEKWQNLYKNTN